MSPTSSRRRTRVLLMASSMRGGGSEHQVALLAEHLPRERFEVHLFLTHRIGELFDRLPGDVVIHSPEPSSTSFANRLLNRWPGRVLRSQALAFQKILDQHSIEVVYDRAFHNTLIAGHPTLIHPNQCRRVSTIVSPPDAALPSVEKRFVATKRKRLAAAYQRSSAIIAVSHAVADSAADYYGIERASIQVIVNPIDMDAVRQHRHNPNRQPDPDYLTLVCVGRMTAEKGQLDLIEAVTKLPRPWPKGIPKLRIQFIGDGPLRRSLESRVAEITNHTGSVDGHQVEFVGTVSPALPAIAAADGLVCPSHFEGMPNVVLEAFALETPVIATEAGGTLELMGNASNPTLWNVAPQSPDSLAKGLLAFASNPNDRQNKVSAAFELVKTRHSIEEAIGRISEVLCPATSLVANQ